MRADADVVHEEMGRRIEADRDVPDPPGLAGRRGEAILEAAGDPARDERPCGEGAEAERQEAGAGDEGTAPPHGASTIQGGANMNSRVATENFVRES
jgi:hypothetical protein